MQSIIPNIIKTKITERKSDSPKITLLWTKNQSKESNTTFNALIIIVFGALVIAFAFFNTGFFFKELIASGSIILMGGILKWSDRSRQRFRTEYHHDNLN